MPKATQRINGAAGFKRRSGWHPSPYSAVSHSNGVGRTYCHKIKHNKHTQHLCDLLSCCTTNVIGSTHKLTLINITLMQLSLFFIVSSLILLVFKYLQPLWKCTLSSDALKFISCLTQFLLCHFLLLWPWLYVF